MSKLRVDKIAAPIVNDEFTGSVYFDGYGSTAGGYLEIPKAPFQFLHKQDNKNRHWHAKAKQQYRNWYFRQGQLAQWV